MIFTILQDFGFFGLHGAIPPFTLIERGDWPALHRGHGVVFFGPAALVGSRVAALPRFVEGFL